MSVIWSDRKSLDDSISKFFIALVVRIAISNEKYGINGCLCVEF